MANEENNKPKSWLENIVLGALLFGVLGVFMLVYPPSDYKYKDEPRE